MQLSLISDSFGIEVLYRTI